MTEPTIERGTCSECGGPTERGPSGAWWHLNPACYAGQFPAPLVAFQPTPAPAEGDHVKPTDVPPHALLPALSATTGTTLTSPDDLNHIDTADHLTATRAIAAAWPEIARRVRGEAADRILDTARTLRGLHPPITDDELAAYEHAARITRGEA